MVSPVRLQLRRTPGFNLQEHSRAVNGLVAVNCARPTIFGNPFVHDDPARAVAAYRQLCGSGTKRFEMGPGKLQFAANAHRNTTHWAYAEFLREQGLPALRGKNLACWCALDAPCHADVLLDLANRPLCTDPERAG